MPEDVDLLSLLAGLDDLLLLDDVDVFWASSSSDSDDDDISSSTSPSCRLF